LHGNDGRTETSEKSIPSEAGIQGRGGDFALFLMGCLHPVNGFLRARSRSFGTAVVFCMLLLCFLMQGVVHAQEMAEVADDGTFTRECPECAARERGADPAAWTPADDPAGAGGWIEDTEEEVISGAVNEDGSEGEEGRAGSTFRLESSALSLDGANWQAVADGDVKLSYEGITLEAQEVFLDVERKESFAKGAVRLMHGRDVLSCDALSFQWETQVGAVQNGDLYMKDTGYRILSDFMEKTGPDTYSAEQSTFTTCDCPEGCKWLPWQVEAEEAEVTLGGYAKVRKAKFRLFNIPILYIPQGYLPVKLQRESGFLFPQISQSGTNGWGFGIPYFWAINASLDATLLMEGYTKRGPKPNMEFRYRPSVKTDGIWNVSGFYDLDQDRGRYAVKGRHSQELSKSFYDKLFLNIVSDNTYIEDFPWEVGWTADRLLESNGGVGFRRDNFHASAYVYYNKLVDGVGAQEIAQKGPEITANMFRRPVLWPWLSVSLHSTGTNYVNENGEDRLRGQIYPEASIFFQLMPGLTLSGYGGVREVLSWGDMALYNRPGAGTPLLPSDKLRHRTLVETGAELEARFGRSFTWGSYRLVHMVQPSIEYQYVRKVEGDAFPVVMDGLDSLDRRNWLTYSLRTSLWGAKKGGGGPGGMLAEFRVAQSLALERDFQAFPDDKFFSDVRIELEVNPRPYLSGKLAVQIDPYAPDLRWLEADVGIWEKKRRYGLYVGYIKHKSYAVDPLTRVDLVDVYARDFLFPGIDDTLRAQVTAKPWPWLEAVWNTMFLINQSGKIENHVSIKYISQCKCWSALLKMRQTVRPDDFGFSVHVQLDGLGSF
jgi:LPS-assembly protein